MMAFLEAITLLNHKCLEYREHMQTDRSVVRARTGSSAAGTCCETSDRNGANSPDAESPQPNDCTIPMVCADGWVGGLIVICRYRAICC
jgi:hypothetical protein